MSRLEMLKESTQRALLTTMFDEKYGAFEKVELELLSIMPRAPVYVDHVRHRIVLGTPVIASRRVPGTLGDAERSYGDAVEAIKRALGLTDEQFNQYHLVIPVIGMGATEKHIVTSYKAPGQAPVIFDSKISNPNNLLVVPDMRLWPRIRNALTGMFRSLNPRVVQDEVPGVGRLAGATYQSLGIQSYLDPTSCGYHTCNVMSAIADALSDGQEINTAVILSRVNHYPPAIELESPLDSAWRETFIDPATMGKDDKKAEHPLHYFYGMPLEKGPKRALYYTSGAFILTPVINALKIPTEYAAKVVVNSAQYVRDRLMLWAPESVAAQYLRTTALVLANVLYYGLDSAHMLLRTVTSPINSFNAGWNKHWLLGVLSAVTSVACYTALALFALPFAGVAGASALVTAIGAPIANAFAGIGLSVGAAGVTTGVLLVAGMTVVRGIKGLMNWAMDSFSAPGPGRRPRVESSEYVVFDGQHGSKGDDFGMDGDDSELDNGHDSQSTLPGSSGSVDPYTQGSPSRRFFDAPSSPLPGPGVEHQPPTSPSTRTN